MKIGNHEIISRCWYWIKPDNFNREFRREFCSMWRAIVVGLTGVEVVITFTYFNWNRFDVREIFHRTFNRTC